MITHIYHHYGPTVCLSSIFSRPMRVSHLDEICGNGLILLIALGHSQPLELRSAMSAGVPLVFHSVFQLLELISQQLN